MNELVKNYFYDATKDLPVVNPTEKENKRLGIYSWGDDNLFPNYLASLVYSCAIHGGIIRSKVHYTVSAGLNYIGTSQAMFELFFKNGNSEFNLNELSEPLSKDMEVFNGFAITVNFINQKPFQLDHVPFEKLRMNLDGDWEFSEDWSDKKTPTKIFKTLDLTDRKGQQIIVYTEKAMQIKIGRRLTKGIYPAPPYSGGILAIETDIEINNYRRNEINNNFSLGTIVNFNNGQPETPDDKADILATLKDAGQGSSNAGGVMATFNNGKDRETTVTNLTGNNLDSRYLALSKDNKENILLSHSITSPMLFGVKTEGQLGGATEAEIMYNLMKNGYFKYRQRAISNVFQFIFTRLLTQTGEISFNEVTLDIPVEEPKFNFNFSKEADPVIQALSNVGRKKTEKRILLSREANLENFDEDNFLKQYQSFAQVTDIQINVLSLVHEGNSFETVRGILNINASKLSSIYSNLETEGLLSGETVTDKGIGELANNNKVKLTVAYSYEVRPELGQPELIPTSRDFCVQLIGLDRVYSRAEIDQVSTLVDRDVWRFRGGWYHNPTNDRTTKSCRHFWQQNVILE